MTSMLGPVELTALIKPESTIERQRNLFCRCYDDCLEEAVQKAWTSWSCARCAMFEEPGSEQARAAGLPVGVRPA